MRCAYAHLMHSKSQTHLMGSKCAHKLAVAASSCLTSATGQLMFTNFYREQKVRIRDFRVNSRPLHAYQNRFSASLSLTKSIPGQLVSAELVQFHLYGQLMSAAAADPAQGVMAGFSSRGPAGGVLRRNGSRLRELSRAQGERDHPLAQIGSIQCPIFLCKHFQK